MRGDARMAFDRGTIVVDGEGTDDVDVPGVVWDRRVGVHRAPAMLHGRIRDGLLQAGFVLTDTVVAKGDQPRPWQTPELRPYQQAAIDAWELQGRRGLVILPTGSGKTHVALAVMARTGMRTLCLVPTRALVEQWMALLAS